MTASRWPLAAALSAVLAVAAIGGWLHMRMAKQQAAEAGAVFDATQAMELAGAEVPPDIESFYFFILERDAPDESAELANKLGLAAEEHDYVGIAGADSNHNRRVLLAALKAVRGRHLAGLVIIYVGPAEHEDELAAVVRSAGAELRFVPYQMTVPARQETI
jgi:hypothetical protein